MQNSGKRMEKLVGKRGKSWGILMRVVKKVMQFWVDWAEDVKMRGVWWEKSGKICTGKLVVLPCWEGSFPVFTQTSTVTTNLIYKKAGQERKEK